MLEFVWSQLRRRAGRSVTLLLGIFVVAASFTVLTGAVDTAQVRTIGTVGHNYRSVYDILVRPHGSTTALERSQGLVRANYLSGIFGGITVDQYHAIARIPGVDVAAPIAMIGYVLPFWGIPIDVTDLLGPATRQVLRIEQTWTAQNGLSILHDFPNFVYVTRHPFSKNTGEGWVEQAPDVPPDTDVCSHFQAALPPRSGPFDPYGRTFLTCWSLAGQNSLTEDVSQGLGLPPGHVGSGVNSLFPFLLAAVDPVQEARLVHLDDAVVSGRYLRLTDHVQVRQVTGFGHPMVPVIAATRPLVDDRLTVTIRRVVDTSPRTLFQDVTTGDPFHTLSTLPGVVLGQRQFEPDAAYEGLLQAPLQLNNFWTSSPTSYEQLGPRRLTPREVQNDPAHVWQDAFSGYYPAPLDNADTAFRMLKEHVGSSRIENNTVLA
ncbi:MAG: hypothetical protein L0H41_15660, partial [Microlunatus sp.]|nr:hypothetical protein [Microlunatus sp.]